MKERNSSPTVSCQCHHLHTWYRLYYNISHRSGKRTWYNSFRAQLSTLPIPRGQLSQKTCVHWIHIEEQFPHTKELRVALPAVRPQGKKYFCWTKCNRGFTASPITTEMLIPKERRWLSEQVRDWKMQTMPFLFLQPLMALHKSPWLQSDEGLRQPPSMRARPCALWNAFGTEWQQTSSLTAGTTADIILYQTTTVKQAKWNSWQEIYKMRHANWLPFRSEHRAAFKCIIHCHWQG